MGIEIVKTEYFENRLAKMELLEINVEIES